MEGVVVRECSVSVASQLLVVEEAVVLGSTWCEVIVEECIGPVGIARVGETGVGVSLMWSCDRNCSSH